MTDESVQYPQSADKAANQYEQQLYAAKKYGKLLGMDRRPQIPEWLRTFEYIPATITMEACDLQALNLIITDLAELAEELGDRSVDTVIISGSCLRRAIEAARMLHGKLRP